MEKQLSRIYFECVEPDHTVIVEVKENNVDRLNKFITSYIGAKL